MLQAFKMNSFLKTHLLIGFSIKTLLFFSISFHLNAQPAHDLEKLRSALLKPTEKNSAFNEPHIERNNLARTLFRAYQAALSAHLHNACPYDPDCQTYSRQAFDKKPGMEALALSFDRLTRCNRLVILLESVQRYELREGRLYDPVP